MNEIASVALGTTVLSVRTADSIQTSTAAITSRRVLTASVIGWALTFIRTDDILRCFDEGWLLH
jgi:hypothetical protein